MLIDEEVPWFYQYVTYRIERHGVTLQLGVEPESHRVSLRMGTEHRGALLELDFENVRGAEVLRDAYAEGLIFLLDEEDPNVTLRVERKPYVRIVGTGDRNFRK